MGEGCHSPWALLTPGEKVGQVDLLYKHWLAYTHKVVMPRCTYASEVYGSVFVSVQTATAAEGSMKCK